MKLCVSHTLELICMFGRCKDCRFLKSINVLKNRDDMLNCLNKLQQSVVEKDLTILEPDEEYQFGLSEFLELPTKPPLPDIIFVKVCCNHCSKKFRLFVDWYHVNGQVLRINT